MAASGNVTISGNIANAPTGAATFGPFTMSTAAAVLNDATVALSSGNNTVAIPTGTTVVIIAGPNLTNPAPNPTFGGTLTVKGIAGDTGFVISPSGWMVLPWSAASPASIVINASSGCSVYLWSM